MCGIVGYVGFRDCTDVLMDALSKLEYRGYDSAGIAVFENDEIRVAKSKGRLADLAEKMKLFVENKELFDQQKVLMEAAMKELEWKEVVSELFKEI